VDLKSESLHSLGDAHCRCQVSIVQKLPSRRVSSDPITTACPRPGGIGVHLPDRQSSSTVMNVLCGLAS